MKSYRRDWTDVSRDVANGCFMSGYICLMTDHTILGAFIYLLGEGLITPNAIRSRSYTTMICSCVFATASIWKLVSHAFT